MVRCDWRRPANHLGSISPETSRPLPFKVKLPACVHQHLTIMLQMRGFALCMNGQRKRHHMRPHRPHGQAADLCTRLRNGPRDNMPQSTAQTCGHCLRCHSQRARLPKALRRCFMRHVDMTRTRASRLHAQHSTTGEQACSHVHLNAKRLAQASVQACRLSTAYQDQEDLSRACNS